MWLGATDMEIEGQLEWITGSCPFSTFGDWYPGGPRYSVHEDYLCMNADAWFDDLQTRDVFFVNLIEI